MRSSFVLVGAACGMAGCRAPTQVTVEVTTDLPCAEHGGTAITVGRVGAMEAKSPAAVTSRCGADGWVGSLVLVPSGEADTEVAFKVATGSLHPVEECLHPPYGARCIIARRSLRYLANTSLTVPVVMRAACAGVECLPDETCVQATCVSATLDPEACRRGGCAEETLLSRDADAGGMHDGRADVEGSVDAGPDEGSSSADASGDDASNDAAAPDARGDVTVDAPGDPDPCATFGATLSIVAEPADALSGGSTMLGLALEPGADSQTVALFDVTGVPVLVDEAPATPTVLRTLVTPARYRFTVTARRAGCPDASVDSRTFAVCGSMWSTGVDALPLPLADRALTVAGDLVVALSSGNRVFTSRALGDGTLGPWSTPALGPTTGERGFDMTGVVAASAPTAAGGHRVWVLGGLGAPVDWVRALDVSGPGSLTTPPAQLVDETDLPAPVESGAAMTVGDWLYYVGGVDAVAVDDVSRIRFDPGSGALLGAWQLDADVLPHGFDNCAGAALDDSLYVTSARDAAGVRRDTVVRGVVTAATGAVTWRIETALPAPRDNAAVAVDAVGRWLYVVGGNDAAGTATSTVFRAPIAADGSVGVWTVEPPLPAPVRQHEAVFAGGSLHVLGGSNGSEARNVRTQRFTGPGGTAVCP